MKRPKILPRLFYAANLLWFLGLACCIHDDLDSPGQGTDDCVTIEMEIPGFGVPVTRSSMEDAKGEAAVKTVDVLIFDKSSVPKLLQHHKVDKPGQNVSDENYTVTFKLQLPKIENAGMVAVIANASGEVDTALSGRTTKPEIMSALTFRTPPDNGRYEWNVSTQGYTPIPMYGETPVSGIIPGMKISNLRLTRMTARIDVENKVNGDTFLLQEIYLVNYYTSGFIAPVWNKQTGILLKEGDTGYPYADNLDPDIPATASKPENTQESAMKYTYQQTGDVPGPLMAGQIYTYEAGKDADPADHTERICMILKGSYLGIEYYYRVDFTTDRKGTTGATQVENMPLYRNHKYTVVITSAEGIGYDTFEQALNASTVLSNLKTSVLVVDMDGINDIVFDGQYFIGSETGMIDIAWGLDEEFNHRIRSDYTGGWKAEVLEASTHTWLRFPNDQTTVSGTDISQTDFGISVKKVASPWDGDEYQSGQIRITAGRLRYTLTIRRVPVTILFARSNVILQGSGDSAKLTFAVTAEDNATIPAWSQGVFFKWGSLIALSPAGSPYDPTVQVAHNPTTHDPAEWKAGLEGWDKIPYAHENFSFTTPSASGNAADAFREYENGSGFNAGSGIGDICRYITANLGWIEGKWRMPTYADWHMMYEETSVKTAVIGDFMNLTGDLNADQATYFYGTFNPLSGLFMGMDVTASTPSATNMAVPPEGVVFLPATGHRYPNGDGDVVQAGAYGYHWSSTPYGPVTVDYPLVSKYGVEFYDADRSYAFPVRCVKTH